MKLVRRTGSYQEYWVHVDVGGAAPDGGRRPRHHRRGQERHPQDRWPGAPGDRRVRSRPHRAVDAHRTDRRRGAGDAFVIVSLAGTIFFNTSVEQARGKVVLFLVVTMAPFAVLAPFIGLALDRVQQGRKYLLAGTLLARGLLCYAMSAAVKNPLTLLPAAFGVLVLQKAFGVVRASVAPRLLPEQITLVARTRGHS